MQDLIFFTSNPKASIFVFVWDWLALWLRF